MVNLSNVLNKYKSGWIALTPNNKLISNAKTLKEVLNKASKKGVSNPTVIKVAPFANYFIG
jgi:hypothetical protein